MKFYQTPASKILDAFNATDDTERGEGYRAMCPVHEADGGHKPSLIIDFTDDGKALTFCQSRRCEYAEILAAVGLTADEMNHVSYLGQTLRGKRETTAASPEQRATLEARAFRASLTLSKRREAGDPAILALAERFGLPEGYSPSELGIGWEETDNGGEVVVYTRTADGHVAWLQRRDLDDTERGWLSTPNPGKGTDEEARWDAIGYLGKWRGSGPVVLCEGASDGITAAALGTFDVLAVRGATMAARVEEVRDLLVGRSIVIAADEDEAGEGMTRAIIDATDPYVASASWIRWGTGVKGFDVREFRAQSPGNFRARFAHIVGGAERHYRTGAGFNCEPYINRAGEGIASAIRDYVRSLGYDLAYASGAGWLFYDGTRWTMDAEPVVVHLAGRLARDYGAIVSAERSTETAAAVSALPAGATGEQTQRAIGEVTAKLKPKAAFVRSLQTSNALKGAFEYLRGHPTVQADLADFDSDPDVLAVGNGVIELRTGKLREMRPVDRITSRLAVGYRADAKAPRFEAFLREVFVTSEGETDEELVAYMKRLIGYAITGHSSEQAFWLLHSPRGSNGKSQFLRVLEDVFSAVTGSTSFATFESGNGNDNAALSDLAGLRNARIVLASEGSGKALNEDRLKAVTGEDLITCKRMRMDMFSYRAKFTMLLATNNIPEFSDDPAVWRRVRIVPFLRHFKDSEQVKGIGASIANDEAEGILALAVAEAAKWFDEGLPACRAITTRTADERADSDPLQSFLAFNVEEGADMGDGNVLLVDLWHRFAQWTEAMGEDFRRQPDLPQTDRQLKKALIRRWDLPSNVYLNGEKSDKYPIRWAGRRLVAASIVNERFNSARADALGLTDYMSAGARVLDLGEDPGVAKYADRIAGLAPLTA